MSTRIKVGHVVVFAVLALAGLAIAADHAAAVTEGRGLVAVRAGEAGDAAPVEVVSVGPRKLAYCGYAPCGMPILCPGQEL